MTGVFFGSDFVSVTKDGGEWQHLKPAILGALMEHFVSGAPCSEAARPAAEPTTDEFFDADDEDTVDTIKELIETRVRPAVGGRRRRHHIQGLSRRHRLSHMRGACSGCPSSTATLKHGIENLLKHFVPGVQAVEQI